MATKTIRCKSCGSTWPKPDASAPFNPHVCPKQLIDQYATFDPATGNVATPATFKPTPNPRNENLIPSPDDPTRYVMVSEGNGVEEVN